jgi:hypothetical protein
MHIVGSTPGDSVLDVRAVTGQRIHDGVCGHLATALHALEQHGGILGAQSHGLAIQEQWAARPAGKPP